LISNNAQAILKALPNTAGTPFESSEPDEAV
jgi:hypothetical protein